MNNTRISVYEEELFVKLRAAFFFRFNLRREAVGRESLGSCSGTSNTNVQTKCPPQQIMLNHLARLRLPFVCIVYHVYSALETLCIANSYLHV